MLDYMQLETKYEFDVYPKRPVTLVKGKNALMWDTEGNEYIDCVSGHGVSNLGHANEAVLKAINDQAQKLITCSNVFYNDKKALILEKIIDITPKNLTRAFLCNSGTEAVEAAIKFARFATGKTDFICAMRGFHGRSFGAMSATFKKEYREPYEPVVPGFTFAVFNNFEKLKEQVTDKTAAIMLEPVQGEGGVNIGEKEFLQQVQKFCNNNGILFILDEIQTGFCRTGKMFALEYFDLQPDVLLLAKAIANGIPMGAVLCTDKMEIPVGRHGTTFGGNPLAAAAALATIEYMQAHKLDKAAKEKGEHFLKRMQKQELTKVREIRSLGLMIGIELKKKVQPVILELLDKGILAFPAGATVLRIFPPVTIEYDVWDTVIDKLVETLS